MLHSKLDFFILSTFCHSGPCQIKQDVTFILDRTASFNIDALRLTMAGLHLINNVLRNTTDTRSALVWYPVYNSISGNRDVNSTHVFKYSTLCDDYLADFLNAIDRDTRTRSFSTRPYEALSFFAEHGEIDTERPTAVITVTDGVADTPTEKDPLELIRNSIAEVKAKSDNVRFLSAGVNAVSGDQRALFMKNLEALATDVKSQLYLQTSSASTNEGILEFIGNLTELMISNGLICPDLRELL